MAVRRGCWDYNRCVGEFGSGPHCLCGLVSGFRISLWFSLAPLLGLKFSCFYATVVTMRKLKFHEKKLLKKVNFLEWKREGGHGEAHVMQRYHVTGRDDYKKYSSLCWVVQKLVNMLMTMDPRDPFRIEMTDMLLEKLYNIGVIPTRKSLALCDRSSVSSFCRRRLSTILVKLKFAEHLKEAVTYIEQGHIRVGPEAVTDPAFLVTRNMEDFVTWVDSSKIKRKVLEYNDKLDDYDAMN